MSVVTRKIVECFTPAPSVPEKVNPLDDASLPSKEFMDNYELGQVLGQGAFGILRSCKRRGQPDEEYAVKMMHQVETKTRNLEQEVNMLRSLQHPVIVKLHDAYFEAGLVCVVLDLYKGGDMIEGMQSHWEQRGLIEISTVQNLSKMIAQSIHWLHQNGVVHRNLKGDNFMMDRRRLESPHCRIFLGDFGTACAVKDGERLSSKCGTMTYWAPEFYSLDYSFGVDVWAMGVVMFSMVTCRFPFKDEKDVKTKPLTLPSRVTNDCADFILRALTRDEQERLTAKEAIGHNFMSSIRCAAEVAEKMRFTPDIRESSTNAGIAERKREQIEHSYWNASGGA